MHFDQILLHADAHSEPRPAPTAFVYYLMIGPATVKIGTTTNLSARLQGLRSDAQYVVALEVGGAELERARHKEFTAERIGRRENFRLSDRLRDHITALQGQRATLLDVAVAERATRDRARR